MKVDKEAILAKYPNAEALHEDACSLLRDLSNLMQCMSNLLDENPECAAAIGLSVLVSISSAGSQDLELMVGGVNAMKQNLGFLAEDVMRTISNNSDESSEED